jgi:maleylacetate reductase
MIDAFVYAGSPARIIFGNGAVQSVGEWIAKSGCSRALVLSTPAQEADAALLAGRLGGSAIGIFSGAAMHTPVEVTEAALALVEKLGADCVVSLGGGSTTGLGKAIAYRTDLLQIAVPTTYAGSEVTPILGQTENGIKTTVRDARILPEIVIYDPELTIGLPAAMTVTSGLNAMAHAAEALYAQDRNPISTLMAAEGLRALKHTLPRLVREPQDLDARGEALYGAWLCGTVLGAVGMALHHKLCHTLGGSFDTPHAETHAILLPHTVGFNAVAVPDRLKPISDLFGGTPGAGLHDFAASIGAPMTLKSLGLTQAHLDRAAAIATQNSYWNPRPIDRHAIRALLQDAWEGARPKT